MYDMHMSERSELRMTLTIVHILAQFLQDPDQPRYGYDLRCATGIRSATMYRTLWRLTEAGWLTSEVEATGTTVTRGRRSRTRPPRTYYLLTPEGTDLARALVAAGPFAAADGEGG